MHNNKFARRKVKSKRKRNERIEMKQQEMAVNKTQATPNIMQTRTKASATETRQN